MNQYSQEFKDKCKEVYPDYKALLDHVERDHYVAGIYLEGCQYSGGFSAQEILNCNNLEDLETLKLKAKAQIGKMKLYSMWYDETREWK